MDTVMMDPFTYQADHNFIDVKVFYELEDAILLAGGDELKKVFHDWFFAHTVLYDIECHRGMTKAGECELRRAIKRLYIWMKTRQEEGNADR
jgi:hypothetical protein